MMQKVPQPIPGENKTQKREFTRSYSFSHWKMAIFEKVTRWWFQRFVIFIPIWGRFPSCTNIFQMG